MSVKRQRATSFERIDFDIQAEDKPAAPPAQPRPPANAAPVSRPPAPSMPPDEIPLAKRFDPHNTGRLDTEFAQFQRRGPMMAFVVVMLLVFVVALVIFLGLGLSLVMVFG